MIPIIPNYASSKVPDVPINWFAFALMLVVVLFIFGACCFGTQMLLRDKKQEEERVFLLQDMEPTAEDEEPNEEKSTETVENPAIIHNLACVGTPYRFALGQMVGPAYRIQKVLGQGATSTVFEVENVFGGMTRAMKCIEKTNSSQFYVKREVGFLMRLRRVEGVVKYLNWCTQDDFHVIVTDNHAYTLLAILKNHPRKALSSKTLITILYHLVKTVRQIHSKHIIHRDIHPKNVMIKFKPEIQEVPITIIDFGLSMLMKRNREPDESDFIFTNCFHVTPNMINENIATRKDDLLMCIYTIVCMLNTDPFWIRRSDDITPVLIKKTQFEYCPERIINQGWLVACVKPILAKKDTKAPDYDTIIEAIRLCEKGFDPKFHKLQFLTGPNGEYLE
ncbi:hypothetical protein CAEBREN_05492 [Caenorhabditis brenneri]|uniref:Protein kinase domain-containing protein n=1 Tax=Caenorhabditis brenneri TaxID=135651 RepID=G0N4E5_CAEBE|nr:hypothetical protein CAEBREN_05492 [Caenorhabditis brenneri]